MRKLLNVPTLQGQLTHTWKKKFYNWSELGQELSWEKVRLGHWYPAGIEGIGKDTTLRKQISAFGWSAWMFWSGWFRKQENTPWHLRVFIVVLFLLSVDWKQIQLSLRKCSTSKSHSIFDASQSVVEHNIAVLEF